MDLQDLVKKKGGQKLDPKETSAKMAILKEIADMASGSMGDDIKGLKKVTVASNDKEGLADGLDKAKDMISKSADSEGAEGMEDEAPESAAEESDEEAQEGEEEGSEAGKKDEQMLASEIEHETGEDEMTDDEIDELIQLLESKKKKA